MPGLPHTATAEVPTRQRILRAALQLFFEHGYKDVSYDMLMRKTGLSKGAIYHYFKSKDELLVSVFELFLETAEQYSGPPPAKPIADFREFRKVILDTKRRQVQGFLELMEGQPFKMNKSLFFVEALSENYRLAEVMGQMMAAELSFVGSCISRLQQPAGLLQKKHAPTWARVLYYLLQVAEMELFLVKEPDFEKDLIHAYRRALDEFERLVAG